MITISGTATERSIGGASPVPDATIAAYENSNESTPIASTTTNAAGEFSFTITTTGVAISGFLKATKTGYRDTYLYPPSFISEDLVGAPINMVTPDT